MQKLNIREIFLRNIDNFKELRAQYDKENPGTFFGSWAKYAVEQRLLYNPLK